MYQVLYDEEEAMMEFEDAEAGELFQQAFDLHRNGELDEAIVLYQQSIEAFPTAEAYTFLGWAHSHKGDIERAIELCHQAIEVDPDFGNPYNDIGAYLIKAERYDEALPWLEKAMRAERYDSYHYPHLNAGRLYLIQYRYEEAAAEFRKALEIEPRYLLARQYLRQIQAMFN